MGTNWDVILRGESALTSEPTAIEILDSIIHMAQRTKEALESGELSDSVAVGNAKYNKSAFQLYYLFSEVIPTSYRNISTAMQASSADSMFGLKTNLMSCPVPHL